MPYSRPDLPYLGSPRKNNKRYENLTKDRRAPTAEMFDSEMNYVVDSLNGLEDTLKKSEAGKITGSDSDTNKDKVLKTDGKGNLSWVKEGEAEISDKEVKKRHLAKDSVGEDALENEAVTSGKIKAKSVKRDHLSPHSVGSDEIAPSSIVNKHIPYSAQIEGRKIWEETMPLNRLTTKLDKNYPNKKHGIVGIAGGVGFSIASGARGTFLRCKGEEAWPEFVRIKGEDLDAAIIKTAHLDKEIVTNKNIQKGDIALDRLSAQEKNGVLGSSSDGSIVVREATQRDKTCVIKKTMGKDTSFSPLEMGDFPQGATPCYMARWRLKDLSPGSIKLTREFNPFGYVEKVTYTNSVLELILSNPQNRFIGIVTPEVYDAYSTSLSVTHPFIARSSVKEKSLYVYNVADDGVLVLYKIV